MPQPYKVFTIYAREDAAYLKELRGHLGPLEKAGRIKVWSDSEINPSAEWEAEIVQNLDTADIILILVSAAYYDSAYIHEKEIKYAILRHERGEAKVLPIIVRPCSWADDPVVQRLQVLPSDGKPVSDKRYWHERDDAWLDVVNGLKRILNLLDEAEKRRAQAAMSAEKAEADAKAWLAKRNEYQQLKKTRQAAPKQGLLWSMPAKRVFLLAGIAWPFLVRLFAGLFNEAFEYYPQYHNSIWMIGSLVIIFSMLTVKKANAQRLIRVRDFFLGGLSIGVTASVTFAAIAIVSQWLKGTPFTLSQLLSHLGEYLPLYWTVTIGISLIYGLFHNREKL